jgi:hypothetical protein
MDITGAILNLEELLDDGPDALDDGHTREESSCKDDREFEMIGSLYNEAGLDIFSVVPPPSPRFAANTLP